MTDSTKPTSSETAREKYMRLVAGPYASTWEWIGQELLVTFISGIKGALGLFLRRGLYPMVLKDIDRTAVVGASVTLRCPKQLRLGRNVIIDDYVQLIGNSSSRYSIDIDDDAFIRSYAMLNAGPPDGYIRLGKNSGIGQSTIIYGNGGVEIGNNVMVADSVLLWHRAIDLMNTTSPSKSRDTPQKAYRSATTSGSALARRYSMG